MRPLPCRKLLTPGGLCWIATVLAATHSGAAESRAAAAPPAKEIQAIRAASSQYLAALRSLDGNSIASHWTPNGVFVDLHGQLSPAQELVRQEFPSEVKSKEPPVIPKSESVIRLLSPTSAVEHAPPASSQSSDAKTGTEFVAIWVKRQDRWLLDFVRECQRPQDSIEEAPVSQLNALSWLVGEWEAVGEGLQARISVRFSEDRKYLLQRYVVSQSGTVVLRGEQRIAWDPANSQIRSWLFRSDGGFVEGTWQRRGDTWIVHEAGVLPNGEQMSTVNLWAHESPDTCWFKAQRARIGEAEAQELVLEFKRVVD